MQPHATTCTEQEHEGSNSDQYVGKEPVRSVLIRLRTSAGHDDLLFLPELVIL
jgi:hypothetical protein